MNSMVARIEHRQQQKLSPRLQQAVRLLQLSSLDFKQEIQSLLGENPFLESDEPDQATAPAEAPPDEPQDGPDGPALDGLDAASPDAPAPADDPLPTGLEDAGDDRDDVWQNDGHAASSSSSGDGEANPVNMMVAESSLAEHLHGQLNLLPLPERDLLLAKAIVECLDDDGYLRITLDELLDFAELDPPASPTELQIALKRVQSLEPAGVAARSVSECLLLQTASIECPHEREAAQRIVSDHIDALAAHDTAALSRQLSMPLPEVESACARIRRLDPHPGWRFGSTQVQYVTPDVVVKKVRGEWTAQLNPAIVPRVRVNSLYADMFQRHGGSGNNAMAVYLREARWTIRNVEQRFATILSVAQSIVKRQRAFFEYGVLAMKPLGLREIADEVGVHESTVSRVTNNKFMAAPHGVLELKYFFSRAMTATSGAAFSGTAIRGLVKDMIGEEAPGAPLSDAEITRRLAQQGLVLARRTVTKYRQQLHLAPVELRRRQGVGG
jgi:RNA polymerase sigma-54 factor